jgi:hypothetical protein
MVQPCQKRLLRRLFGLLPTTAAMVGVLVLQPSKALAQQPLDSVTTLRPVDASRLAGGPLTSSDGRRAGAVLRSTDRYAMTTWWPTVAPVLLDHVARTPRTLGRDEVRRLGMQAFSLAVSLRTGAYDPRSAGASVAAAKAAVVRSVSVVCANHAANRAGGWGNGGQSSLWSSFAARAGWLLWDDLTPLTRQQLQSMLVLESDLAVQMQPQYLRDRLGRVVRPGNTAAEENAWQALPLQLATATMPDHPHWVAWRHAQIQLMLSAWTRPQDVSSTASVNGAPLASWVDGSNIEANGTLVNHQRVAPDYTTNLYQNLDGVLVDALAGVATPEAVRVGLAPVYGALATVSFSARTYAAPGGTTYQPAGIYYPQGCDWGTGQYLPYALVDAQAAAFGFGSKRSAADEVAHIRQQQRMQQRFADGRTFASNAEYRYVGREEHTAQLAAQLYLTKLVRDRDLATFTDQSFFVPAAREQAGLPERDHTPFTE